MAEHDLLQYFVYEHLPPHLQEVSKPFAKLAREMDNLLPSGTQKDVGLQKLIEAKDALVRASLNK